MTERYRASPIGYCLGLDLGGSSVKAVAVTPSGKTLARINSEFDPAAEMNWADHVRQLVHQLQDKRGARAGRIGLSAPGLAAADGRSIAYMPGRLQGLEGLIWANYLQTVQPVPVMNDAHAALLGEAWIGAARNFKNVILLTLGTGVGGAAIVDGRLLRGSIGRAGHLGHTSLNPSGRPDICGTPGSLELAIGNCSILERSQGRFRTTHQLIAAHVAGDIQASAIWLKSVEALAAAICSFINILDPEAIIIGGGIARAGSALFGPLRKFVKAMEWRPGGHKVKLLPAKLGEFAGAFGAAANASSGSES